MKGRLLTLIRFRYGRLPEARETVECLLREDIHTLVDMLESTAFLYQRVNDVLELRAE